MKKSSGIILKDHAPYKQKVSLLDKYRGHIIAIFPHMPISAGTVLEYHIEDQQRYFIKDVTIVEQPLALAKENILFLHHMLELIYLCIPEGLHALAVYQLLLFVFNRTLMTNMQKKKILCVLYAQLGLYSHDEPLCAEYMYMLEQEPLPAMIERDIDINIEKNISRWLYQCIRAHIDVRQLKTVHFLDEI